MCVVVDVCLCVYGVATISMLLKILGLFCRVVSFIGPLCVWGGYDYIRLPLHTYECGRGMYTHMHAYICKSDTHMHAHICTSDTQMQAYICKSDVEHLPTTKKCKSHIRLFLHTYIYITTHIHLHYYTHTSTPLHTYIYTTTHIHLHHSTHTSTPLHTYECSGKGMYTQMHTHTCKSDVCKRRKKCMYTHFHIYIECMYTHFHIYIG